MFGSKYCHVSDIQRIINDLTIVESTINGRIKKKVYESGMEGRQVSGRPNRLWMDGVRKALNNRGLILE